MAGPNLTYHNAIGSVQTYSGNTPLTRSIGEQAGQTFKLGVPVQLNAGFIRQWDGTTIALGIAGFSLQTGANLSSNGKGQPVGFGQVGFPGSQVTYGSVPYEAGAVNIPVGAPMTDGRTEFEAAIGDTVFEGQYDNAAGNVAADYTPPVTVIGTQYGLTVDASGQFYVDANKNTVGTNTVLQVVGVNPIDISSTGAYVINARLRFVIVPGSRQIS